MRLIDADALNKDFRDFVRASNNSDFVPTPTWNDAVSLVGSAPTVDAVPIVRCYECVQSEPCLKRNSVYCNKLHDAVMRNWYCADGEKRKE